MDVALGQTDDKGATVSLESVSKHYGQVHAVEGATLLVNASEFVTLLGPSGSGKTTLLRVVAGFVTPSSGKVVIDGREVSDPPYKRNIGMVFQNYALFPHMTAGENIAYPLKVRRNRKREIEHLMREALDIVGLKGFQDRYPRQLSGGQQQRVALARALVFRPRLILLDEPLGALDRKLRENLQFEIKRIQRELGLTMIYVTHDQGEAMAMSDRIAVMNEGRVEQIGTPEDLYERPVSKFSADFLGESTIFQGEIMRDGARNVFVCPDGVFSLEEHLNLKPGTAALVLRPERIRIVKEGRTRLGPSVEAVVRDVIYLGSERKYELITSEGIVALARYGADASPPAVKSGDRVVAYWSPEAGIIILED